MTAFDANKAMTDQARTLLQVHGALPTNVSIVEHDANKMPEDWSERFTRLISVNVGCNLADLRQHFSEAYRVASAGATMLVTAPNSLTTVFDDGAEDGIDELLASWEALELIRKIRLLQKE